MSRKTLWIVIAVAVVAGAAGWFLWQRHQKAKAPRFVTAPVTKGDVAETISATGTLQALDTVDVGSQVSATITEIKVDFNDRVKAGQVLAVLDTKLLDAAVNDANAGVSKARAQLDEARANLGRNQKLFDQGYIAAAEFLPVQTAVKTAQADVRSAQSALERAQKNRTNAIIVSPTDGVVLDRAVQVGQTVAASFNTPHLFTIAKDLTKIRILANVDESDIGQIRPGQKARFTVSAFPTETHEATVDQIRLQPQTLQNVVNYTVVLTAENPDEKMLPGMTATADFEVSEAHDAWLVPAAALRFRPPPEVLAEMRKERQESRGQAGQAGEGAGRREGGRTGRRWRGGGEGAGKAPGGAAGPEGAAASGEPGGSGGGRNFQAGGDGEAGERPQLPPDVKMIYFLTPEGKLRSRPVRIGPSDGKKTAVTPLYGELSTDMKVVTGIVGAPAASTQQGGQQRQGQGGGRGGGGFRIPF